MAMVQKPGQMVQAIQAIISWVKKTEKVNLSGRIIVNTLANLKIIA